MPYLFFFKLFVVFECRLLDLRRMTWIVGPANRLLLPLLLPLVWNPPLLRSQHF